MQHDDQAQTCRLAESYLLLSERLVSMSEPWLPIPGVSAVCRACGELVSMLDAPLHVEDHVQAGTLLPERLRQPTLTELADDIAREKLRDPAEEHRVYREAAERIQTYMDRRER